MELERQAPIAGTALVAERLLPDVALTDAQTGAPWRPSHLRQRAAVVLCFVHADCDACEGFLAALADRLDQLRWADAQAHAVAAQPFASALPVLLDTEGKARARMLGPHGAVPTVVIADRYTAVAEAYRIDGHDFPAPEEIVATLRVLSCDCS